MEQGPQAQRVPRRVAQGFFSLIFFIVLCVLLVVGYVPLILHMLRTSQDLKTMESKIKDTIDEPLRQMGQMLPLEQQEQGTSLTYGGQYFTKLGELAKQGVAYTKLVEKTGYGESPGALKSIEDGIAASDLKVSNLKEWIDALQRDLAQAKSELETTGKSLADSRNQTKMKTDELTNAQAAFKQQLDGLEVRLDADHQKAEATLADYKKKLDETSAAWKKVWDEKQAADAAAKEAAAKSQGTIAGQTQQIAELREELKGKQPAPKAGPFGNVLECDLVHRFCMIDRGTRDGVTEGQALLVYREGIQNTKLAIGKVVVVRVYDNSSRVDVVSQDEMKPIASGDWVYVNPPEGAAAPASEAAPAMGPAAAPPPAAGPRAYVNMGVQ